MPPVAEMIKGIFMKKQYVSNMIPSIAVAATMKIRLKILHASISFFGLSCASLSYDNKTILQCSQRAAGMLGS